MSGVLRKFKRQNGDHLSTGDREVRDALRADLARAEARLCEQISDVQRRGAESLAEEKLRLELRVAELEAKFAEERQAWSEAQEKNYLRFLDLYRRVDALDDELAQEAARRERADAATITAWLRRLAAAVKRITFRALRIGRAV